MIYMNDRHLWVLIANAGFVHETQPKAADSRISFLCFFKVTVENVHRFWLGKREERDWDFYYRADSFAYRQSQMYIGSSMQILYTKELHGLRFS